VPAVAHALDVWRLSQTQVVQRTMTVTNGRRSDSARYFLHKTRVVLLDKFSIGLVLLVVPRTLT
jgi:hypothetical protein